MPLDKLAPKRRYRRELNDQLPLLAHRDLIHHQREQMLMIQLRHAAHTQTATLLLLIIAPFALTHLLVLTSQSEVASRLVQALCFVNNKRVNLRLVLYGRPASLVARVDVGHEERDLNSEVALLGVDVPDVRVGDDLRLAARGQLGDVVVGDEAPAAALLVQVGVEAAAEGAAVGVGELVVGGEVGGGWVVDDEAVLEEGLADEVGAGVVGGVVRVGG